MKFSKNKELYLLDEGRCIYNKMYKIRRNYYKESRVQNKFLFCITYPIIDYINRMCYILREFNIFLKGVKLMKKTNKFKLLFTILTCILLCIVSVPNDVFASTTHKYVRSVIVPSPSALSWGKSSTTFHVNAGDSVKVSWDADIYYVVKLKNKTTGNFTSTKYCKGVNGGSVKWTGLRSGEYIILVQYGSSDYDYYEEPSYSKSKQAIVEKFNIKRY